MKRGTWLWDETLWLELSGRTSEAGNWPDTRIEGFDPKETDVPDLIPSLSLTRRLLLCRGFLLRSPADGTAHAVTIWAGAGFPKF